MVAGIVGIVPAILPACTALPKACAFGMVITAIRSHFSTVVGMLAQADQSPVSHTWPIGSWPTGSLVVEPETPGTGAADGPAVMPSRRFRPSNFARVRTPLEVSANRLPGDLSLQSWREGLPQVDSSMQYSSAIDSQASHRFCYKRPPCMSSWSADHLVAKASCDSHGHVFHRNAQQVQVCQAACRFCEPERDEWHLG
jgi:hypothetical protein